MNKALERYIRLLPFFGIGVVVIALMVSGVFFVQRGAHVELVGSIQKVRTLAPEETSTLAFVDFRFQNPSDYAFIVRSVQVFITGADGKEIEGQVVADSDVQRVFQYYPDLGQKFNESLTIRTKINPKQGMDRMISARFDIPEAQFKQRKNLRIHVVELDGPKCDIVERPQ